jgi:hypothetical protein
MVQWGGSETHCGLETVARELHLTEAVEHLDGADISVNNGHNVRIVRLRFVISIDWISMLGALNNMAEPSARVTKEGCNCVLCGLCGATAKNLEITGADIFIVWKRSDDVRWKSIMRFLPFGPERFVWEPLHCHNRCLDIVVHLLFRALPPSIRSKVAEIVSKTGRSWKNEPEPSQSLIIKEVYHIVFSFKILTNTTDKGLLPERSGSRHPAVSGSVCSPARHFS